MKTKHIAGASIGLIALASTAGAGVVGCEKYSYDAAGNVVEKQIDGKITRFGFEGNTIRTSDQGTTCVHDEAGRLLGESSKEGAKRSFSYQYGDKVTKVENGGTTTELFYNAEGHLVGKAGGQTEAFAWDGLGLVMRKKQAFANEEHMVGGVPAIANGEVIVSDHLGSTLNQGINSFESSAFGEGMERGLLTGKPFIEELDGFVFARRNYSAAGLRWNSADPSGYPDGCNSYAYVQNRPIDRFDRLGLKTSTDPHISTSQTDVTIDCWEYPPGNPTMGVSVFTVIDSTYKGGPKPPTIALVSAYGGASGSSQKASLSVTTTFTAPTGTSCTGAPTCPHNESSSTWEYGSWTSGAVDGFVTVSFTDTNNITVQVPAQGTKSVPSLAPSHAEL